MTMWGVGGGAGLAVLVPFAIAFGLSTGGYSSMWSQTAHGIVGRDGEKQTLLLSGKSHCLLTLRLYTNAYDRFFDRPGDRRSHRPDCRRSSIQDTGELR